MLLYLLYKSRKTDQVRIKRELFCVLCMSAFGLQFCSSRYWVQKSVFYMIVLWIVFLLVDDLSYVQSPDACSLTVYGPRYFIRRFFSFYSQFHISFQYGAQLLYALECRNPCNIFFQEPPLPPPPPTFIFAIFVHHYFAAHKSVGILCVCLKERMGAVQDYTYQGKAAQDYNSSPVQVGFPHHCVAIVSIERFSLHTEQSISSTSFPSTRRFLPFYPALPSFLPSNSFLSTQHFLPFYPAIPSFLPSNSFLSTQHFLPFSQHFLPCHSAFPFFSSWPFFRNFFLDCVSSKFSLLLYPFLSINETSYLSSQPVFQDGLWEEKSIPGTEQEPSMYLSPKNENF